MAAMLLLAAVALAVAVANGASPRPVIAYAQVRTIAHIELYVAGPGGTHEVGQCQEPSVETVPFGGGRPTRIVSGDSAWNG